METERSQELVISTSGLTKTFGTTTVVSDLHLEVRRGDVFGFMGPNGAGKTTTIRMLLGLIQPTLGSVSLFGQDISTHLREALPRIGAIVETPVFYPYLSGADNLRIVAAASSMRMGRTNQARIDEVLSLASDGEDVTLAITDNGEGFAAHDGADGHGLGLRIMRERVEELHGAFDLKTAPGEGTRIAVRVLREHTSD